MEINIKREFFRGEIYEFELTTATVLAQGISNDEEHYSVGPKLPNKSLRPQFCCGFLFGLSKTTKIRKYVWPLSLQSCSHALCCLVEPERVTSISSVQLVV